MLINVQKHWLEGARQQQTKVVLVYAIACLHHLHYFQCSNKMCDLIGLRAAVDPPCPLYFLTSALRGFGCPVHGTGTLHAPPYKKHKGRHVMSRSMCGNEGHRLPSLTRNGATPGRFNALQGVGADPVTLLKAQTPSTWKGVVST